MSVITLTINGTECSAPVGASLLDACRQNGVELPTLCHLEGLTPVGAGDSAWCRWKAPGA